MNSAGPQSLAVVGAGWAGLAAAVRGVQAGARVTLLEMSGTPGGRARSVTAHDRLLDNGQHILIGAYARTLDLMRTVNVDPEQVLARMPLALVNARGHGLKLPPGSALASFLLGVLSHPSWSMAERLGFILQAGTWALKGFRCVPDRPVAQWCHALPPRVVQELIEPLCVAALNTSADQASAAVFLRVLRDALFSGNGGADLLLPKRPLGELLPEAAMTWLREHGAVVRLGQRARELARQGSAWLLDGELFDAVILAATAREAGRLTATLEPLWSAQADGFEYEPIITAWIDAPRVHSPFPMLALQEGPAQFAFDHTALGLQPAQMSLVISGAQAWVDAGASRFEAALKAQIDRQLANVLPDGYAVSQVITEKRATFKCTPALARPAASIAPGLAAAGDYVRGPYPATLEGAVRAGEQAVALLIGR